MLDDQIKLAQEGWTKGEKVKRRLQREFLTVAEFGLISTITHNTGGFEVRSIADPAVALKQTTAANGNALKQIAKNGL